MPRLHKMVVIFDGEESFETVRRMYAMASTAGQTPTEIEVSRADCIAIFGAAQETGSQVIAAALAERDAALAARGLGDVQI